ncbi:phytanoyl-CoA dioxygenase family protein [Microbacterium sp. LRZ72]|uniref:phytanoyl-CoA dioxygenase family protein n=1 Tax=Microbacterium sp. LRZ72 TaxID=2942481 RepID=UPI0029B53C03|nr:phytanoyl-CoA dioxygenase family protein [Microbacterium sp. LRZ72]MDX2377657.1 phytanoyl-CoA dioxygenase family protein [Microbacterium sp. LRZ72]
MWNDRDTTAFESLCADGIAFYPGLLDADRCAALLDAVAWSRRHPSSSFRRLSPEGVPSLESDLFRWRDVPEIRDFVTDEKMLGLARAYLSTDDPVILEDQWFWSEAGSATDSPWHQDDPYHPLDRPFLTIWVPLTPVPAGLGLRGVAGSHEKTIYSPVEFSSGENTLSADVSSLEPVPDVDAHPDLFSVIDPAGGAGDAVILDSRTLHSAGGACPADFVRLSIRYADPATVRRGRAWPTATFWDVYDWKDGDPLPAHDFPRASSLLAKEPA